MNAGGQPAVSRSLSLGSARHTGEPELSASSLVTPPPSPAIMVWTHMHRSVGA